MRKSRSTEEQIIGVPKEHQAGVPVAELCRRQGISEATFHAWRSRPGSVEVSDAKRLKALEDENRKLKKLLAEAVLDVATLKEAFPDAAPHRSHRSRSRHHGRGRRPMLTEVMRHYGLVRELEWASHYETEHYRQICREVRAAILAGRLIAVSGIIGSGRPR